MSNTDGPNGPPSASVAAAPSGAARPSAAMPRRQLAALCAYSLAIWSLGNGILPLLPKVASLLHADATGIGVYLAISYTAIALGTLAAGWMADRLSNRKRLMLVAGLAGPPFVVTTYAVTELWQLIALTAVAWWLGGLALALANILGGLGSGPRERGRVLGVLAMMAPAGSILGGLGVGALADALGYTRMWLVLGLLWLACPAAGLFVQDVPAPRRVAGARPGARGLRSTAFTLLLVAGVLGAVGSFTGSLGRSLVMQDAFSAQAIDSTIVVSGLVTLPFPLALGALSDRLGRVRFIALCYAAGVGGLLAYSVAASLPEFWLATSLLAFVGYVAPGVMSALVVDLVDRPAVGRGLALMGATGWIGGILGFASAGYVFQSIGFARGFLLGGAVVVCGLLLLAPVGLSVGRHGAGWGRRDSPPVGPRKG